MLSGLSRDEARAYEALVRYGSLEASALARKAGLTSRTIAYKVLAGLVEKGLAEKKEEEGKVARFTPAHPLKLKDWVEKKETEAKNAINALGGVLGKLTSDFNLISGKPGVRFYEGKSGMKAVLDDSLTAREIIYTYVDIESIEKYIPDVNKEYSRDREKYGIQKRGIILDTPFNRKYLEGYHTKVTNSKFIKLATPPFHTIMQIYDNKVSYITLRDENMIGVIVADPHIYGMHRALFEYIWSVTPDATESLPRPSAPTPPRFAEE